MLLSRFTASCWQSNIAKQSQASRQKDQLYIGSKLCSYSGQKRRQMPPSPYATKWVKAVQISILNNTLIIVVCCTALYTSHDIRFHHLISTLYKNTDTLQVLSIKAQAIKQRALHYCNYIVTIQHDLSPE